ncbi:PREDICTED: voltage-dependent T-type calcium channel subunit alpha-1G-like, partial [Fulmarus glacialis]|uniref:voltage-dependent T-type calcium channel subunit alpha-1G-like n=1 Tax=Fulmarus glacialis TaxID=30455 RepID=UPI00051AD3AE
MWGDSLVKPFEIWKWKLLWEEDRRLCSQLSLGMHEVQKRMAFEHVSMLVILLNCVTLGMFQPCEDVECQSERCTILEAFDDFIFAFFAVEMVIKMVALGIFGQKCYLGDTWNRLDFFIVMAGMMEYSLDGHNVSLSAIRTVRVLRPLRAINRVP